MASRAGFDPTRTWLPTAVNTETEGDPGYSDVPGSIAKVEEEGKEYICLRANGSITAGDVILVDEFLSGVQNGVGAAPNSEFGRNVGVAAGSPGAAGQLFYGQIDGVYKGAKATGTISNKNALMLAANSSFTRAATGGNNKHLDGVIAIADAASNKVDVYLNRPHIRTEFD